MADFPSIHDIRGLAETLKMDNQPRNQRDQELINIYENSTFTGKLNQAMDSNTITSGQRKLFVNICRTAMIDRATLLLMLPDIKVDPADGLPYQDSLFWQQMVGHTLKHYFWEEMWQLPERMPDLGMWLGITGRACLQIFPDIKNKTMRLWMRDPSTYYAVVSSSGAGFAPDITNEIGYTTSGGYIHSPVLFIYSATGRDITKDYPHAAEFGIKNTDELYERIEYYDEQVSCNFIEDKKITYDNSGTGKKYRYMTTSKGEIMGLEHNLGFIPVEYIQDMAVPGKIDATTSIYHAIEIGENINDLLMMNTEEHRERLGGVLLIKNPTSVPNPWPKSGNAVVTVGPDGDAKWVNKVGNPNDMASHIAGIKEMAYMGLRTSGVRMGETPNTMASAKGINAAASIPISDEVLTMRNKIAHAIKNCDYHAWRMMQKMFPDAPQKMSMHSVSRGEALEFAFGQMPESFRHKLEVFPLAHDIPQLAVLMLQMKGQEAISLRSMLERLPGFDAPEEIRRLKEERMERLKEEVEVMAMMQGAQGGPQGPPQGGGQSPEGVEASFNGTEKGAMPLRGGAQDLVRGKVPTPTPGGVGFMPDQVR